MEFFFYNVILEETHNLFKNSDMTGATWKTPVGMAPLSEFSNLEKFMFRQ